MTMNQQEKDALSQNWDQAKTQIQSQFPGVTEDDLNSGKSDPSKLAQTIADRTGEAKTQVESALKQVAQQYAGGQGGQSQTQS